MKNYLSNPFSEAYVTHTVSEDHFVKFFSPILVIPAGAIFQPGNVVVRGTQGSGKSMLLRLLDPEIRMSYFKAETPRRSREVHFPVPAEYQKFVSSRVDLNKSGLLDIANTLPEKSTQNDVNDLAITFGDFFNFWLLRGLLECLDMMRREPAAFEGLVTENHLNDFASTYAEQDCFFGSLKGVSTWDTLKTAVKERVVAYRAWANGNRSLDETIKNSKTSIGEPLARAAEQLKLTGVLSGDTNVLLTIDQIEALWMQGPHKRELGVRLRREIHEVLGKRDNRVSYRVGVRKHDWGKDDNLAMRDGRNLEEERDFLPIDIDELLRRGENSRRWAFRELAKDVFRRRVRTTFDGKKEVPLELEKSERFFGPSPTPQEIIAAAIKQPDPTGERLLRLDSGWSEAWIAAIMQCYHKKFPGIPNPPVEGYPCDPLNALLLAAWGLQTGGVGKPETNARRLKEPPPETATQAPWDARKQYWRKERYPQAVLQLVSRHQQKLLWWGEAKVLSLCGGNILRFITICRETWDYWQRLSDDPLNSDTENKAFVAPQIQARAIAEASRKTYEALKRQPGSPAGDVRIQFLNAIASWLRNRLLGDTAMSYPGGNGFSLRLNDLKKHPELKQLIEEAVGWGDLYERDHTSKSKAERSREPRRKYYPNPALAPEYQLPEAHTKEPLYASVDDVLALAIEAGVIQANKSKPTVAQATRQATLFPEDS